MYKNHNSLLHNLEVIAICYYCITLALLDINLQPLSINRIFGEHLSFLPFFFISELLIHREVGVRRS